MHAIQYSLGFELPGQAELQLEEKYFLGTHISQGWNSLLWKFWLRGTVGSCNVCILRWITTRQLTNSHSFAIKHRNRISKQTVCISFIICWCFEDREQNCNETSRVLSINKIKTSTRFAHDFSWVWNFHAARRIFPGSPTNLLGMSPAETSTFLTWVKKRENKNLFLCIICINTWWLWSGWIYLVFLNQVYTKSWAHKARKIFSVLKNIFTIGLTHKEVPGLLKYFEVISLSKYIYMGEGKALDFPPPPLTSEGQFFIVLDFM